ncbi:MAG TPA: nuclear transport factor 2 family protein [Acidimicrobiales bacterium]|nr:nuclear transport factor 2 family protein [Acidimicrobiales bacterium]
MAANPEQVVSQYGAAWTDMSDERRRSLLEECWAADGVYCDPMATVTGRQALAGHIAGFSERLPGHTIKLTSGIDAHDGFARFGWEMYDAEDKLVTEGMDFAVFGEDGRITRIVGFFGPLPPLDQPPA